MSIHSHKNTETRDRLRSRLNQRKEKFSGATAKNTISQKPNASPYPSTSSKSASAVNVPKSVAPASKPVNTVPNGIMKKSEPSKPNAAAIATQMERLSDSADNPKSVPSEAAKNPAPKVTNSNAKPSESMTFHRSIWSISTCSLNSLKDNADSRDINDLLNYIEGNKNMDKVALAEKKAAKKARQKEKKVCSVSLQYCLVSVCDYLLLQEQERQRFEEEKLREERRLKEEKRKEEERLKLLILAKELAENSKKNKKGSCDNKVQKDGK